MVLLTTLLGKVGVRKLLLITTLLFSTKVSALTYGHYDVVSSEGPFQKSCTGGELITRRFEQNTMIELSPSILFTDIGAGKIVHKESGCTITSHSYWVDDNTRLIQEVEYGEKCEGGASELVKTLDVKGNELVYTHIQKDKGTKQKSICSFKLGGKL